MGVQRDTVSSVARTLLPLMAKELWFVQSRDSIEGTDTDDLRRELLDRLASWNGEMDRYSPEPLLFWTWVWALQQRILKDEFPIAKWPWMMPLAGWSIDMGAIFRPGPGGRSIHWTCSGRRSVHVGC